MVTKEQAIAAGKNRGTRFHWTRNDGTCLPTPYRWKPNGVCKTWKTRPNEFRLPIKYGLYDYAYITPANAKYFHLAEDCSTW